MTTCPRCGRPADDQFVCAGCGAFLAGEETGPAAAVSVGRVAVLVLLVCLLGAGGAALLLRGGGGHPVDRSAAFASSPVELSNAPLGSPGAVSSGSPSPTPTGHPSTSTSATRTRTPSPTASTSARPSRSASTSPNRAASTSAAPHPSTSHSSSRPPTSKPPSSSPSSPPLTPAVRLSKGTLATCGPHCFPLVVTLINFGAGAHTVQCFSGHDGQFGSYATSATTSSGGCTYRRPNDTVYVVVEGHHSNTVIW